MTWLQYQDKINKDFFGEIDKPDRSKDIFYCNAGKVLSESKDNTELTYREYCCKLPDWVLQFR